MTGDHMRKSDELDSFIKVLETFLEQHESFATKNDDMVKTVRAYTHNGSGVSCRPYLQRRAI